MLYIFSFRYTYCCQNGLLYEPNGASFLLAYTAASFLSSIRCWNALFLNGFTRSPACKRKWKSIRSWLYIQIKGITLYTPPPEKKRKKKSHTPNNKTNYNLDIITMIYEDEVISKSPTEESIRTGHRKMSCMHSIHRHLYSPSPQQQQQKYSYKLLQANVCLFVCVYVFYKS